MFIVVDVVVIGVLLKIFNLFFPTSVAEYDVSPYTDHHINGKFQLFSNMLHHYTKQHVNTVFYLYFTKTARACHF